MIPEDRTTGRTGRIALALKGPLSAGPGSEPVSPDQRAERLRKATSGILTLPTLPTVATRLLELVDDTRAPAKALAQVIGEDQVLTARLLKLANSAYYGFARRISTVNLAIVVLGFDTVRDLGLSVSVVELFKRGDRDPRFDLATFWEHCLSVAIGTRHLARLLRWKTAGEAFTAGILHDLGKVVLHQYQPMEFDEMTRRIHDEHKDPLECELEVIGATHAEVGGWLCERWNLPPLICKSVAGHHGADNFSGRTPMSALVHLSDILVHRLCNHTTVLPIESTFEILSLEGAHIRLDDIRDLEHSLALELGRSEPLREALI